MFRLRTCKTKIVVAMSAMLLFRAVGYPQSESTARNFSAARTAVGLPAEDIDGCSHDSVTRPNAACSEDNVSTELSAMREHGDRIAHAHRQALEILETRSACAAWFQESDRAASEVSPPCTTNWIRREPLTLKECEANLESHLSNILGAPGQPKSREATPSFLKCQRTILSSTISRNRFSRWLASCSPLIEDRFL
jgi:hypothetical protein